MTDPITITAASATVATNKAVATAGLIGLLAGWFGSVATDVMLVALAAFMGGYLSLAEELDKHWKVSLRHMVIAILAALILAWWMAEMVSSMFPSVHSPYLQSVIAAVIGYSANKRLPKIFNGAVTKAADAAGVKEEK